MGIELCAPSWSFRTAFMNRELDLVTAAERVVKELAIGYIDIFDSHFHSEKDLMDVENPLSHAEMLRKQFDNLGVKVAGISAANDLSIEETADSDVARLSRWIDICPALGTGFVRINTGRCWMEWTDGDVHFAVDRFRQNLESLLTSARKNQVTLVLENHPFDIPVGELGQQYIQSMRKVIELDPEVLAICADDGHIEWDTPEEWRQSCGELLSEAKYMHTKCGRYAFYKTEELLFSIDSSCEKDLDCKRMPEELQTGFKKQNVKFSPNVDILIHTKGSGWRITDGDRQDMYFVRKEEDKLNIFRIEWPASWKERVSLWHEKNYDSFIVMEYVDTGDAWEELGKVINNIVEAL